MSPWCGREQWTRARPVEHSGVWSTAAGAEIVSSVEIAQETGDTGGKVLTASVSIVLSLDVLNESTVSLLLIERERTDN